MLEYSAGVQQVRFGARALPLALLVAGIIISSGRPASAGVTAAAFAAATPSYTGPCPVVMAFSGTINGTPGVSFQYSFNRYVDGKQQVQNVGAATIPAGGSLAVSDSFSISGSSSGVNLDQVWVHNIAGGQMDVYSNRAAFAVNCGTPPSPGSGSPGKFSKFGIGTTDTANQLVYGVPPPYNLASTTDPHVCPQHGGFAGVLCIQAVPDKYLILVWDWSPNDKWPAIDGYHVYDVTGGPKTRVQDQTNPQATVEFFKPGSYTGKCYAVSAYKGTNESGLSASVCAAGAAVGVKTLSLSPNPAEMHYHEYCGSGICGVPSCFVIACAVYTHVKEAGPGIVGTHVNNFQRGYFLFDPAQIAGRNVYSAKLSMVLNGDPTCLGGLGTADGSWVGAAVDVVPPATLDLSIPMKMNNTNVAFDVTSIVRDWARGGADNGFVLFGTNENTGAEDNGSCYVGVVKAALSIQY